MKNKSDFQFVLAILSDFFNLYLSFYNLISHNIKTREKILLGILIVFLIAGAIGAWIFIREENKVKEYSTYCMDAVRAELGEYLENVHMNDSFCYGGACVYMGGLTYEGVDYDYACKVYNKENVGLELQPLYPEEQPVVEEDIPDSKMRVVEGQTEEETQAMVKEACDNMGGTWADESCMLEDGSYVNF